MQSLKDPKLLLPLLDQKLGEKLEKSEAVADIRSFQLNYKNLSRTPDVIRMMLQLEFRFTGVINVYKTESKEEKEALLKQDWYDSSFVVSDYAKPEKWCKKAVEESQKDKVIVCLLPARTNTQWFHTYALNAASEIRFVKGRIQFTEEKTNPTPDALVIFKKRLHSRVETQTVVLNNTMTLRSDQIVFEESTSSNHEV